MQHTLDTVPWYRQFWPWFIIALPASAVIGGLITIYLATHHRDGLVVDDYYKEGLAINQSIDRDHLASRLDARALVRVDAADKHLNLQLSLNDNSLKPEEIQLKLIHPTLSQHDQQLTLVRDSSGNYSTSLPVLIAGRWHLIIEPDDRSWRLTGRMDLAHGGQTQLLASD